ncbi:MAG: hypothetical protein V4492_04250 [Chlamydiota bacterium]
MFQRTTRFCLLFFVIATLFWGYALVFVRPSDIAAIKKTIAEQQLASSQSIVTTTEQKRTGVVKEIWFTQEDKSRLQYRIFSQSSLLTLKPDGKKFDLIEKLDNIQCWMQDKIYAANAGAGAAQQIRYFQAQEGLYRYHTQEFLAHSVALSLYKLGGQQLPQELGKAVPFLKGKADDVSFAISGKNPQFNAQHFKAELGP